MKKLPPGIAYVPMQEIQNVLEIYTINARFFILVQTHSRVTLYISMRLVLSVGVIKVWSDDIMLFLFTLTVATAPLS